MFSFLKPYMVWVYLAAAIALVGSGWKMHSWYADSVTLSANKQVEVLTKEFRTHESKVSNTLEAKLKELKANERTFYNESTKIIEKPVYSNQCLSDDGILQLNTQRGEQDPNTGKSAD